MIFPQSFCYKYIEALLIFMLILFHVTSLIFLTLTLSVSFWPYLCRTETLFFFHYSFAVNRILLVLDRAKSCDSYLAGKTRTNTYQWYIPVLLSTDACLKNNGYLTLPLEILLLPAHVGPIFLSYGNITVHFLYLCIFLFGYLWGFIKWWQFLLHSQPNSLET